MKGLQRGTHAQPRSASRTSRRVAFICLVAAVLALAVVPSTYAYLTAQSARVVNTFAGGAIALVLDETPVDADGQATEGERVTGNTYTYVPGATLDKDPTVTVLAGSEECYVFLYVDDPLPAAYFTIDYSTSWTAVATSGTATLYVYASSVDAAEGDVELAAIFTQIAVSTELTSEQVLELGQQTVVVQAYAVQADGLTQDTAAVLAAAWFNEAYGTAFDVGVVEAAEDEDAQAEAAEAEAAEAVGDADADGEADEDGETADDESADGDAGAGAGTDDEAADDDADEDASADDDAADEDDATGEDAAGEQEESSDVTADDGATSDATTDVTADDEDVADSDDGSATEDSSAGDEAESDVTADEAADGDATTSDEAASGEAVGDAQDAGATDEGADGASEDDGLDEDA